MTTTCTECYRKILDHDQLETSRCLSKLSNRLNCWTVGDKAEEAFSKEQKERIGLFDVIEKYKLKLSIIRSHAS